MAGRQFSIPDESTAAAADQQADRHQGSQQQAAEPLLCTLGQMRGEEADREEGADDDQAGLSGQDHGVVLG